jgi:hypothetical protein
MMFGDLVQRRSKNSGDCLLFLCVLCLFSVYMENDTYLINYLYICFLIVKMGTFF